MLDYFYIKIGNYYNLIHTQTNVMIQRIKYGKHYQLYKIVNKYNINVYFEIQGNIMMYNMMYMLASICVIRQFVN